MYGKSTLVDTEMIKHLKLEKTAKIEGDSNGEPPHTFYLDHLSDVMRYWSELEFHSLHSVLDEEVDEDSSDMPPPPKSHSESTQAVLSNPKNWRHKMNRLQRVLLDKHIIESPQPDYQAVGQSLQLSSSQVALYHVNKQRRRKRNQPQDDQEQQSTPTKKTKKQKNKNPEESPEEERPPIPPQPEKTVKAFKWKPIQKSISDTPKKKTSKKSQQEETPSDTRPTRVTWTTQEDLLLLQTFVANKTSKNQPNEAENEIEAMEEAEAEPVQEEQPTSNNTPQHLQQWKDVSQRLGKPPTACHRRFLQLMKKQNYYRAVQVALADKQLSSTSPLGTHYLPSSIQQLKEEYNVKDLIGSETSVVTNPVLGDLIKMILLTPDSEYNPEHAYEALQQYSQSEIDQCFHQLKSSGVIVKSKGATTRGWQLSLK